jgi:hypothetical protein
MFLLIIVLVLIVFVIAYRFYLGHKLERFEQGIVFAKPGTYAPNNNCYESVMASKNLDRLGTTNWDRMSRSKILSLLTPGKAHMSMSADYGSILNGKCYVQPQTFDVLGVDAKSCRVNGKELGLIPKEDGTCEVNINDDSRLQPFLEEAYQTYDSKNIKTINELQASIDDYKAKIQILKEQYPRMLADVEALRTNIAPMRTYVSRTRQINDNLRQCNSKSDEAISANKITIDKGIASISEIDRRIRQVQYMMDVYGALDRSSPPPPPPPPPPPLQINPVCRTETYPWQESGKYSVQYLDRQHFQCQNNEALAGFQLKTNENDLMAYEVRCCDMRSSPQQVVNNTISSRETDWEWHGDVEKRSWWDAKFLDKHNVDCGAGFLKQFVTTINYKSFPVQTTNDKVHYVYQCNTLTTNDPLAKISYDCERRSTPSVKGTSDVKALTQLNVQCLPGEGLTQFNMEKDNKNNFKYAYTCCKPKIITMDPVPIQPPPPPVTAFTNTPTVTANDIGLFVDNSCAYTQVES